MPWKRCCEVGCVLPAIRGPRCEPHRKAANNARDARRPSAWVRGYTDPAWRKRRAELLARDPYCMWPGCEELSTDADHIVPKAAGGSDELENLRGLCHRHHSQRTASRGMAR